MDDTICAICTAPGVGAISIIRVSGKKALEIVNKIFKGHNLTKVKSHTIHYGYIYDKEEKIDEVLISVMLPPKSYTMEDVVEINSHGGINTINRILELLLEVGCRLAEPGEFTKRAFLNGRIDLTQAESVNDLINAKSNNARMLALNNLNGSLFQKIRKLREKIVNILANIEVNIDYPEYDDIEIMTNDILLPKLKEIKLTIEEMLKNAKNSTLIKEGINIALVGSPNVGKSSILNMLLHTKKAIVTDIPGTTRDIVEGSITLNGFLLNFIDTAGIRKTKDVVEKIGVERSKDAIKKADIVVLVLNNNQKITKFEKDLLLSIPKDKRIIFVNKSDLETKIKLDEEFIKGNTKEELGLEELKKAILKKLNLENISMQDMTYLSNIRQIDLMKKSLKSIDNALLNLQRNIPIDMIAIDINNAWNLLGEITGETYQDELINTLFKNFCLGK